jgi:hypothetical protein
MTRMSTQGSAETAKAGRLCRRPGDSDCVVRDAGTLRQLETSRCGHHAAGCGNAAETEASTISWRHAAQARVKALRKSTGSTWRHRETPRQVYGRVPRVKRSRTASRDWLFMKEDDHQRRCRKTFTDRTLDAAEEISKEPDPLNNTATSNLLERQMTTEN